MSQWVFQCRRYRRHGFKEQPTPGFCTWKIPWMEEAGGLQSKGSQRVRHDWVTFTLSFPCSLGVATSSLLSWVLASPPEMSFFLHKPIGYFWRWNWNISFEYIFSILPAQRNLGTLTLSQLSNVSLLHLKLAVSLSTHLCIFACFLDISFERSR